MSRELRHLTDELRRVAEHINHFMYVDGKTKESKAVVILHTEKEYREFLEKIRRRVWGEVNEYEDDDGCS